MAAPERDREYRDDGGRIVRAKLIEQCEAGARARTAGDLVAELGKDVPALKPIDLERPT